MRSIQELLDTYGESHINKTNKAIHWVCVPAIFFSLVGLFYAIPIPASLTKSIWLNAASVILVLALLYYLMLSKSMTIGFLFWSAFCLWGNNLIYTYAEQSNARLAWISLAIFAIAWVFQFIGHKIEGKKPSFLEDIQFLLIGPAWLMSFIYKKLGLRY